MAKRKYVESESEDAQDQDYRDGQASDDDYVPSSNEGEQERRSVPTRRATQSRSRHSASDGRARGNEEAQRELGDGGADATMEVNTSAAPHQNAADVPQASEGNPNASEKVSTGRVRKSGWTKHCGVISLRIKDPVKTERSEGDFICIICGSNFTRAEGVNFHFERCVERYGNPAGNRWNDHPSCASRKHRNKRPTADPTVNPTTDLVPQPQPPTSKKQRATDPISDPSSADPRSRTQTTRTVSTRQLGSQPTSSRVTRSRAAQRASEVEPDLAIPNIGASLILKLRTSKPITTQPKPAEPKPAEPEPAEPEPAKAKPLDKQPESRLHENPKQKPRSKEASGVGKRSKYHIDDSFPPQSELGPMFHEMVLAGRDNIDLMEALEFLSNKQINVATMCSGTESPLLALSEIQKGLRLAGMPALNIKHLFSAEIVPYKQAYIERNFHPEKLFRDIREIAAGGQATTAYGAITDVPATVDLLVAGFACVDFSKLNKRSKQLTDPGESGDTFRAILEYAKKYRPQMIVLENIEGAPWDLIKAIWSNDRPTVRELIEEGNYRMDTGFETFWDEDDLAYSASWQKVDAKNYYIPQTRTRRYMICLDRTKFSSPEVADDKVQVWKRNMTALERKASAPVEAFLLPEDDPRLQYAKDEMSKTGTVRRETDWEVCLGRHEDYRAKEKLGTSRPILNWTNGGSAKASSYIWTDWLLSQVERIWDTLEISALRNAALTYYDSFFKSRFWELSQNIDRFLDTTPEGVIGCLTPKGQQFSTIRGRPVTGLEAIALQGLPIDILLLTRETQRELVDLAGNAMTSTVVGAAILSGLAVAYSVFTRTKESISQLSHDPGPILDKMRYTELRPKQALNFTGSSEFSLEELCNIARASIRLCRCEGQSLTTTSLIRKCKRCHHHGCEKCGNMPKHDYEPLGGDRAPLRISPQDLRKQMEEALPTRLQIDGFSEEGFEAFAPLAQNRSKQDWKIFSQALLLAFKQEYRYESIKRSHCWTITFQATHSRLELIFDRENIYWLLYGRPNESEAGNSPVRRLLQDPLARLTVRGQKMRGGFVAAKNMLGGSWEIRLPITQTFPILVTPQGELTDSWEKKLGLQSEEFIDKQVFTSLRIGRPLDAATKLILDHEICGDYDLLDNCGTACSSLHKKRPTADDRHSPSLFLFLDPDRNGPAENDSFVFSTDMHRLEYGESRYVSAQVDKKWRAPSKGQGPEADFTASAEVDCTVSSRWESCSISLRPHQEPEEASVEFPKADISMPIFGTHNTLSQPSAEDVYGCLGETATTALLSCVIPGQTADSSSWQVGRWTVMDQKSERQVAAKFAWLFAQVKDLGGFSCGWRSLGAHPKGYQRCSICAPETPKIMWTCSKGGKMDKIIPYEDGREAGRFERKIKARPAPFLVQTRIDNDDDKQTGRLLVGFHLPTLVHRTLARLGNIAESDDVEMSWRLDTRWEAPTRYRLKEFTLTNNKLCLEANYDFPTGEKLRPEQKRSLHWMIGQEAGDMAFYEEEIEEAVLSQLSWRAEVRARRLRSVRGGVLADEVGYGKTATTLALINALEKSAEEYAKCKKAGLVSVKATLILVPSHLVHQWKGQVLKFLGIRSDDEKIVIIENATQLGKISVKQIKKAIIVLVSWGVLSTSTYMARMSQFGTLPMGPSSGAREIEAWLARACQNVEKHMAELASGDNNPKDFAEALKQRFKAAHQDETILRDVPTQLLKGGKYRSWNPADGVRPEIPTPTKKDLNSYFHHMTNPRCTDLNSMTGVLFHMFDFYRIVVDEYTYVETNQESEKLSSLVPTINARSRWVLSGTPTIQDFGDVHHLARLLGCNLGTLDDAAGVLKGTSIRQIRDRRTAAEQFRAFGFSHTAAWHISRQAHAQKFLDKYASKNVPEIDLIRAESHLIPHFLGATETIPNAELQQQLQSTDMQIVLQGRNKHDSDRFRRYKELLKGCKTAAECLIKSCLYFEIEDTAPTSNEQVDDTEDAVSAPNEQLDDAMDIDHDDLYQISSDEERAEVSRPAKTVLGPRQSLIAMREKEMDALIADLERALLHAEWLAQQCKRATKEEHKNSHYLRWKSDMEKVGLKDPTATSALRRCLVAASKRVDADTEEIYYRDPPTADVLRAEKKAADEHKKREKAKRAAERKTKVVSEKKGDDTHPSPPEPKPNKIGKDDFETYASQLRALAGHLRGLVSELTSRTRSLRLARGAQELQQWHANQGQPPKCESCGASAHDHDAICLNIRCGHLTCTQCIEVTTSIVCAVNGCGEGAESFRLRKAVDLVGDGRSWKFGSRLGNIIELIHNLPDDEQVLIFVQFEDLMLKMARGLDASNISNYAVGKTSNKKTSAMMNDFQDNRGENKKKVLLLNPLSETSSGINLTNVNHVIFAAPLLTQTQQSYDALTTQSIGRARRYGQQKTVHIYTFVALRTIDVDILQEREGKTLVKKRVFSKKRGAVAGGPGKRELPPEWHLVTEGETEDTMEAGWGSGYNFRSNSAEEDD